MIYKVDYLVKDKAAYDAAPVTLPMYVVSNGFVDALAKASSYETDNLKLLEVKLAVANGNVAITDGFQGV